MIASAILAAWALACSDASEVDQETSTVSGGKPKASTTQPQSEPSEASGTTPRVSPEQLDAARVASDEPMEPGMGTTGLVDATGAAWRIIDVPAASNAPSLVATPDGWFALSRRSLGQGKVLAGWESALYHSEDGIHWELVPIETGSGDVMMRDLVHGDGTYLIAGAIDGNAAFWTSKDGRRWTSSPQPVLDQVQWLNTVDFAGGRFFAFGFRALAVSDDADTWTLLGSDLLQFGSAAHGNERWVLSGNGPMLVSEDGLQWAPHDVDCAIPDACITDPSGNTGQSPHGDIRFVDGWFYANQMRSQDGAVWDALPGRYPSAYVGDRFIGGGGYHLNSWTAEGDVTPLHVIRPSLLAVTADGRDETSIGVLDHDAPFPESVEVAFEDGLTCLTASCVIVGSRLYLVPPIGTPPLADHLPRDADGAPLLSHDCPVSQMIFCDDYERRSGCECDPLAPRGPESCQDVGEFECEGAFEHREGEWGVAEVGAAGCDCNAVDPSEPATFGDACEPEASGCEAPLACLQVDPLPSYGDPEPPRHICTQACSTDADCPTWEATGHCGGTVQLTCSNGSCQPRSCG